MYGDIQITDVDIQMKSETFEQTKSVFNAAYWLRLLSGAPYMAGLAQNGRNKMEYVAPQPAVPQFKPDYWLQILSGAANGNGRLKTESKSEPGSVKPVVTYWESELWLRLLNGATESK
jgi:hypothetical protein